MYKYSTQGDTDKRSNRVAKDKIEDSHNWKSLQFDEFWTIFRAENILRKIGRQTHEER